jgi:hypothetical protein
VYPNPAKGANMIVDLLVADDSSPIQLEVLNGYGQLVQMNEVLPVSKKVHHEYSINEWPTGLYIIRANVNGTSLTKKFLKTN